MIILDKKKLKALVYRLQQDTGKPAHTIRESCAKGLGFPNWQAARPKITAAPNYKSHYDFGTDQPIGEKPLFRYTDEEMKDLVEELLGDPRKAFEVIIPALRACSHLVSDINNTGGITLEEGTDNEVPVADESWVDLVFTARLSEEALTNLGRDEKLNDEKAELLRSQQEDENDESEGDDLCDYCMRSGVEVHRTDADGKTICTDCDKHVP